MRASRFGQILLAIGGLVGVTAVVGLVVGFEPAKLPAALLNIAVYKLTFAAAGGLLAAGAIVQRYARRDDGSPLSSNNAPDAESQPGGLLGEGRPEADLSAHADERATVKIRERP
jgi:hypothetical protein